MNRTEMIKHFEQRVMLFDGAMGTTIQRYNLSEKDFDDYDGCNEYLNISRPDVIQSITEEFLQAGSDIVETNTFSGNIISLADYQLEDRVKEICLRGAQLARIAADKFSTPQHPRLVAGSIGPSTKLPSLWQIGFDEMVQAYIPGIEGLLEGGADLLLVETSQDLLQAKAAVIAILEVLGTNWLSFPTMYQATIDATGNMLIGSDMSAINALFESYDVISIGINCSVGPQDMNDAVRYLCENSSKLVSCQPNAGIPENRDGELYYPLTPAQLVKYMTRFVNEYGLNIVGGCCGTTPEHIAALSEALANHKPAPRKFQSQPEVASCFNAVALQQEPRPLIVGEEMNTTTQRTKFKKMVMKLEHENILAVANRLIRDGSHLVDLCVAIVGEDEKFLMQEVLKNLVTRINAPLLVDSTEVEVFEHAMKFIPGKPVLNSVNLEDGEDALRARLEIAKKYGAAVIALAIDEDGMALTTKKKLEVIDRIYRIATEEIGLKPSDLIFDALTLPICTGQEEYTTAGVQTLEAVKAIKNQFPQSFTVLGVSNISFGISVGARRVLNSIFTHTAVEYGLDVAIVNYKRIYPYYKLEEQEIQLAKNLIFNDQPGNNAPLNRYLKYFETHHMKDEPEDESSTLENLPTEEQIQQRIIDGNSQNLQPLLEEQLKKSSPLEIINNMLLAGMKVVGELFGKGKMALPSVLASAQTMKESVKVIEPYMDKADSYNKGKMVLATVKGDVHDIGKNLVDIILTNNGYQVINLGIKQPSINIIKAIEEHQPTAVGLSGLLIKSTVEMNNVLSDMRERGISIPVLCGGAALKKPLVEHDFRKTFAAPAYYCRDALEGLHLMNQLTDPDTAPQILEAGQKVVPKTPIAQSSKGDPSQYRPSGLTLDPQLVPQPPFLGHRLIQSEEGFEPRSVMDAVDTRRLFSFRIKIKKDELQNEKHLQLYEELKKHSLQHQLLDPQAIYGYYPCNSQKNDLIIYSPDDPAVELTRFTFPRRFNEPYLCLADYFLPVTAGKKDYISFFVVSAGAKLGDWVQKLYQTDEYQRYWFAHCLSIELVEVMAELVHRRIDAELGLNPANLRSDEDNRRGKRYSFGYPPCPRLEDQQKQFNLLQEVDKIDVRLTENYQMVPEQAVSAFLVHSPHAEYFAIVHAKDAYAQYFPSTTAE